MHSIRECAILAVALTLLPTTAAALLSPVSPRNRHHPLRMPLLPSSSKSTSDDDVIAGNAEHIQQKKLSPIIDRRGLLRAAAAASAAYKLGPNIALADDDNIVEVEAKSPYIAFAKNFIQADDSKSQSTSSDAANPLDGVDWNGPKKRGLNMEQMADAINDGLVENEWFVTGRGKPELFSTNFAFSDPDVSLTGYEDYCRSVRRLFDQDTSRCELVCCSVTGPNRISVLWRNSGRITLGSLQVELKPYLVASTLTTDPDDGNLIVSQVDEFESDPLGLILYQLPFLRPLAGPPAPSVNVLKQRCDFYTCKLHQ